MAATAPAPTLSQISAWDTEHLESAAARWQETADTWDRAYTTIYRQASEPGGTPWRGAAADAAIQRIGQDRARVLGAVDSLYGAARVASFGADEIQGAKRLALEAVEEARSAGFTVGENLSVTRSGPLVPQAAYQAQAQAFAANISARAGALIAVDAEIAAQVAAEIAGISSAQFDAPPALSDDDGQHTNDPTIQAVDHTFKQQPPGAPDDPGPKPVNGGQDVKDVIKDFQRGKNAGVRQVEWPADINRLYDWLVKNSVGEAPPTVKPYKGKGRVLADGTIIRIRGDSSSGGPAIDVVYPDGGEQKIHLPLGSPVPIVAELPAMPPIYGHPPVMLPAPHIPPHTPIAIPPPPADPATLPPLLQNPSPPGFSVNPPLPAPVAPTDSGGSSWLPELGHDAAEVGKAVGGGVLAGLAILGGLFNGFGGSSGQVTP